MSTGSTGSAGAPARPRPPLAHPALSAREAPETETGGRRSARSWMAALRRAAGSGASRALRGDRVVPSPEVAVLLARAARPDPSGHPGHPGHPDRPAATAPLSPSAEAPAAPGAAASAARLPARGLPTFVSRLEEILTRLSPRPAGRRSGAPSRPLTGGSSGTFRRSTATSPPPRPEGLRGLAALAEPSRPPRGAATTTDREPADDRADNLPREGSPLPASLRAELEGGDLDGQLDRLLRREARRHGIDLETP